ncbi:Cysteine proteinase inhibitor [Morella rubra]|uniref:Cysteine proteinase inhibitor n=1 Tax=Morella rubra TaxID=262757 RepID=A0A6A1WQI3_9ROSI|nr:Cysteine proteinase inhibitor [Morella rubra]
MIQKHILEKIDQKNYSFSLTRMVSGCCVEEHNKTQNALLQFGKVVNVKQQVLAGTMYYITLEATNGGKKKLYEAKVLEQPWLKVKELEEFKLIGDDAPSGSTA